jgi:nitrite transporter NirC
MVKPDVERIAGTAVSKVEYLDQSPVGYFLLAILAGIYLGFGITLIFSVGAPFAVAGSPAVKLVMGTAFGIALTLVIFAGSELFTGNNMVCAIGALARVISWHALTRIFAVSLLGNAVGSLGLAWLVAQSGVLSQAPQVDLVMKVATTKMTLSGWELLLRGILCNWLVCLALWTASRTSNEMAKLLLIFWCLLAFVGSGFEHSIANQSLLGLALFLPHPEVLTWTGFLWNQGWVIVGNVIGGSVFVGGAYWVASAPAFHRQVRPTSTTAMASVPSSVPTPSVST